MSKLDVRVGADTGPLATGLAKARGMVGSWSKGIKGKLLGAFAFGTVTSLAKQLLDDAENLSDAADRYKVSTEFLQKAANAAKVSGSSFGDVEITLKALVRRSQLAIMSNNEYRKSWESLGVSVDELKGKSPEQLFYMLQEAVGKASDRNTAFKDTVNVAGDSAKNLFTIFNMGKSEFDELGDSMGVWDEKTTRSMANTNVAVRKATNLLKTGLGTALYWIINGTQTFGALMGATFLMLSGLFSRVWDWMVNTTKKIGGIVGALGGVGVAIKKALSLDLSGAMDELRKFREEVDKVNQAFEQQEKGAGSRLKGSLDAASDGFNQAYDEIWGKGDFAPKPADQTPDVTGMSEQSALLDKYNEAKKKADFEALSTEEKILALEKRKKELKEQANQTTQEGLTASLELLEVEKELRDLQEDKTAESEKQQKADDKKKADLEKLRDAAKQSEEERDFNKLSDQEQLLSLLEKEKELQRKANDETAEGLKARKELAEVQDDIANRQKEQRESAVNTLSDRLNVDTDFLARVGGGGFTSQIPAGTDKIIQEHQRANRIAAKILIAAETTANKEPVKVDTGLQ